MKLKIKICGMRDEENIQDVSLLQPDYMGFIYYPKSPRFVGNDFTILTIDTKIQKTGVFVNSSLGFVSQVIDNNSLDAVQLHGEESADMCLALKLKGATVIKAFAIDEQFDFASTLNYQYKVDYFLFDTKGKNFGGNGSVFDWSLLEQYKYPTPFFLSGGLSLENINQVANIKNPNLFALDLNSGVEDSPGVKNVNKIKSIIKELKAINKL